MLPIYYLIPTKFSLDDHFDSTETFQSDYGIVWNAINPEVEFSIKPTIEEALELAREIGNRGRGMQTLVTGSLYLVGGALTILESNTPTVALKASA